MKLKIAQKLLFVFLLTAGLLVAIIISVANYSISNGFANYLAQTELESLDALPQLLSSEYKRCHGWKGVFADPEIMEHLIRQNESMHNPRPLAPPFSPPESLQGDDRKPSSGAGGSASVSGDREETSFEARGRPPDPDGFQPPPPFPPFRVELFQRIGVFDLENQLVWGNPEAKDSGAMLAVISNGKTVGNVCLAPSKRMSKEIEYNFVKEQSQSLLVICLIAFLLAAAAAILLSRDFAGAIDELVSGTRRLIAGDYKSKIEVSRSDELGQLANDLNKLADTLKQHDRAHKQWLADTSHELRTPVAVLWAQVEALQDGIQEPNQRSLAVLHEEVRKLAKMIDDLHDLAKFDVDDLKFTMLPTDIGAILRDVLSSFTARLADKRISLDADAIAAFSCVIQADSSRLKQLFANLIENSIRYTDEGGVLRLSAETNEKFASIYFDDSEPGVPEEALLSIFDRFYRVESSRSRLYGGSGLGLAICKTIVHGHNASIRALRSPLGGLQVVLSFPLKREAADE